MEVGGDGGRNNFYVKNLLRRPGSRAQAESQSLIVLSFDADAICFPSGKNATATTLPE